MLTPTCLRHSIFFFIFLAISDNKPPLTTQSLVSNFPGRSNRGQQWETLRRMGREGVNPLQSGEHLPSPGLWLLICLLAILIPACASSSPAVLMMYSAYKLNKQGDNIQPWQTPFPIWKQSVVPCPVLTVASWPTYRFLKSVSYNELALCIRWPTYWRFSFNLSPVNIQDWFPLELTGLISLQSKGLLRVFSYTTVQKHQFFSAQPSLWSNSHIHTLLLEKP